MAVRYTNDRGPLVKEFRLVDGKIQKTPRASLASGLVEQINADNAPKLAELIKNLGPNQCVGLGNLIGRQSARLVLKGFEQPGEVSRTTAFIKHLPVVSPVLFDLDDGGISRATANRRWEYGLSVIVWRLNGRRVPMKRGRRYGVEGVRSG